MLISIHRMFRFYLCIYKRWNQRINISIHRMFRFYALHNVKEFLLAKFQYIVCFGSTLITEVKETGFNYFNTSYVSVLHLDNWVGKIQMLNFNTSYVSVLLRRVLLAPDVFTNFNTSYVSVLHLNLS
jgi:hypothetical protein